MHGQLARLLESTGFARLQCRNAAHGFPFVLTTIGVLFVPVLQAQHDPDGHRPSLTGRTDCGIVRW
jgi:hypothetical protein